MSIALHDDVVFLISDFLTKDDILNFLNTCQAFQHCKSIIFKKYVFDHRKIKGSMYPPSYQHVINIKGISNVKDLEAYPSLRQIYDTMHLNKYLELDEVYKQMVFRLSLPKDGTKTISIIPKHIKNLTTQQKLSPELNLSHIVSLTFFNCDIPTDFTQFKNLQILRIINPEFNSQLKFSPTSRLKQLCIHSGKYNHPFEGLPSELHTFIIRGNDFQQQLNGLPQGLQTFVLKSKEWNHPIDQLPISLQRFEIISNNFDQQLDQLPPDLKTIGITSDVFNSSMNQVPITLRNLKIISSRFNQCLDRLVNLTCLYIKGNGFSHTLEHLTKLVTLIMECDAFCHDIDKVSRCLKTLVIVSDRFNQDLNNLPETLETLILDKCYNYNKPLDQLPINLKCLKLLSCFRFDQHLNNLPNIKILELKSLLSIHNKMILPLSLEVFKLYDSKFNFPLVFLPHTLKVLEIYSDDFDQSIPSLLTSLEVLKISGKSYNQTFDHLSTLTQLEIMYSEKFNQSLDNLSKYLETLKVYKCCEFKQKINSLPENLKTFELNIEQYQHTVDCLPENITRYVLDGKVIVN